MTYEKQSRVFVYTPVVDEKEYIGQESNTFLKRYYDGDITAMLSAYIENDKLSETEINNLRSLLSQKEAKRRRLMWLILWFVLLFVMYLLAVSLEYF